MFWIKDLIGPHHSHQILCFRQIDDVVGVAREHMDGLDPVPAHLELQHFLRADLPLLNETVARHHDEELPLAVVPVLALGDAGLGDVHGKLAVIDRFQEFRKAASRIAVHLQIKGDLFFRKVTEIHGIQLLLKTARRDLRHNQRLRLVMEGVEALHDMTKRGLVGDGRIAVFAVRQERKEKLTRTVLHLGEAVKGK